MGWIGGANLASPPSSAFFPDAGRVPTRTHSILRVALARLARRHIVTLILQTAILANVVANLKFPSALEGAPIIGLPIWSALILADATAPGLHPALVRAASSSPAPSLPDFISPTRWGSGSFKLVCRCKLAGRCRRADGRRPCSPGERQKRAQGRTAGLGGAG